jgi:hypothetical protein
MFVIKLAAPTLLDTLTIKKTEEQIMKQKQQLRQRGQLLVYFWF